MAGSHCCFARGCISSSLHPFVMGNVCVSQGQTHTLCLVIRTLSGKWKTVSLYSRKQCLFSSLAHHTADAGVLFVFWNVCLISLACNLFCPWNSVYLYFTLDVTCYHFKESLCDHTKEGICVALSSAAMAVRIKQLWTMQNYIISHFWRPEVWEQGIAVWFLPKYLFLAYWWPSPLLSYTACPPCLCPNSFLLQRH